MNKKKALELMEDINTNFILDDEFEEEEFLTILKNYITVEDND